MTGFADRRTLAVLVSDPETKQVQGGVLGRTSLGLLFIDLVFLPEALRRGGIGRRMIALAEEEGRRRGCVAAVLYTISFQAPEFYAKLGYREFGRIPCLPPGTSRVFMTKPLD
jgi:GNAT superfamily N-acetyltransferase